MSRSAVERKRVLKVMESKTPKQMIDYLSGVSMIPGSFDKRFRANISEKVYSNKPLTSKQRAYLEKLVAKYRKQIFKEFK